MSAEVIPYSLDTTQQEWVLDTPETIQESLQDADILEIARQAVSERDHTIGQLAAENAMKAAEIENLHFKLERDSKTGLLTGTALRERVLKERSNRRRADLSVGEQDTTRSDYLFFADFDDFKFYNDYNGEVENDKALLIPVVGDMEHTLRDGDLLARWGGEEFAGLIRNVTDEEALTTLERLQYTVTSRVVGSVRPSLSVGYAKFGKDIDYDTALVQAQIADKEAKNVEGKGTIINYEEVAKKAGHDITSVAAVETMPNKAAYPPKIFVKSA